MAHLLHHRGGEEVDILVGQADDVEPARSSPCRCPALAQLEHLLGISGSIENMPFCSAMKASRGSKAASRARRLRIRAHISSSSACQSARSSGSSRMIRATAAPWSGGIDHIVRARLKQVAEGDLGARGARRLDEQIAGPLAIDSEILVAALRDDRLARPPRRPAGCPRHRPRARCRGPDRRGRRTG